MKGKPGLTYDLVVQAMISAAMLYPGEIAWTGNCSCSAWRFTPPLEGLPSGYDLQKAIENGHRNSEFSH